MNTICYTSGFPRVPLRVAKFKDLAHPTCVK